LSYIYKTEHQQNNFILPNLKLKDSNLKTSSNNSKNSKSNDISYLSEIEPFQTELYTIEELKEKENENNCENLHYYDLNEKKNYEIILQILENKNIDDKNKIENFNNIMYKLNYDDRIQLLDKYKTLFDKDEIQKKDMSVILRQTERLKKIFINIIKDILSYKPKEVIRLFHTKYFVETQTSNIPFLEGNEEFIFANLINDIYDTFIVKSNYHIDKDGKPYYDSKYLSNIIKKDIPQPVFEPILITKETNYINDVEMKENEFHHTNEINFIYQKFISNKYILSPILEIYSSKEFQKKHEEFLIYNPEFNDNKKVKYIYEIILESLFYYCVYLNEDGKTKIISEYAKIFYESEEKKLKILNDMDIIKIKDKKNKNEKIFKNGIKNKDYNVYIDGIFFKLNLYDYNIIELFNNISNVIYINEINEKKEFIETKLNDCRFWTIQKHAKVNSPYLNKHIKEKFSQEVINMLKHDVLKNMFNEINLFESYKYPFLKDGFIRQVKNSIIYVPLPTKLILGLTIKKMGIIIINKGRHSKIINEQKNKNSKFILKLGEFFFYKITLLHEINFHYFLLILYSNNKRKILITPEKVFKNYKIETEGFKKLDFWDKGEALLFGARVNALYIKAIINVINLQLWDINRNLKPKKIGEKFMEINKEAKASEITLKKLIDLSGFAKVLYEKINEEKNIKEFDINEDIGKIFAMAKY